MLPALIITLREGFGAFLVIGVMLAVFRRASELQLLRATRWGIALSILATPVAALLFSTAANQALWEGILALAAAAFVAWMGLHMWHVTRSWRAGRVRRPGVFASIMIVFITMLMITRGSMEMGLLLGTMLWQVPSSDVIFGTGVGATVAVVVAWLWARLGRRVPQPYFRQITAAFLFVFFLQLLVDGIHEIAEANAFAGARAVHEATEAFSSDGVYGQYTAYLLIAAPLAWWLVAIFWGYGKATTGRIAHLGR